MTILALHCILISGGSRAPFLRKNHTSFETGDSVSSHAPEILPKFLILKGWTSFPNWWPFWAKNAIFHCFLPFWRGKFPLLPEPVTDSDWWRICHFSTKSLFFDKMSFLRHAKKFFANRIRLSHFYKLLLIFIDVSAACWVQ